MHSSCDSRFVFFAFYNNSIFHSFVLRPMEPTLLSAHNCTFVFLFLNLDNLSRFDLYCIIHNLLHLPFKYSQCFLFQFHSILLHTKDIARCCVSVYCYVTFRICNPALARALRRDWRTADWGTLADGAGAQWSWASSCRP